LDSRFSIGERGHSDLVESVATSRVSRERMITWKIMVMVREI